MGKKIVVYTSWENIQHPQENNPKNGEVVKVKVIQYSGEEYFIVQGYERMLNGVKQCFPACRFREATYGEIIAFKIQKNEAKDLPRRL